jgi:hypothetical protein
VVVVRRRRRRRRVGWSMVEEGSAWVPAVI